MSLSTYYFPEQVEEENRGELANPGSPGKWH